MNRLLTVDEAKDIYVKVVAIGGPSYPPLPTRMEDRREVMYVIHYYTFNSIALINFIT